MQVKPQQKYPRPIRIGMCICFTFFSVAVFLSSGCSWMYTELKRDEMRRAEIRDRGVMIENMQREEDDPFSFDEPVNPQNPVMPGDVEPELE